MREFKPFFDLDAARERIGDFYEKYPALVDKIIELKAGILTNEVVNEYYNNPNDVADYYIAEILELSREYDLSNGQKVVAALGRNNSFWHKTFQSESEPLFGAIAAEVKKNPSDSVLTTVLAGCYSSGIGVDKNLEEAFRLFTQGAGQENLSSLCNLGICYLKEKGVKKNPQEAVKFFSLAAERGYPPAQNALGSCYCNGVGVDKNLQEAFRLIGLAAAQGYPTSLFNLSICYFNGIGVEQNNTKGYLYCARAVMLV